MHIAAANPTYVRRDEVPADGAQRESEIYRDQMADQKKPADVIDKIVDGKLNSFYEQFVLLDQASIRDPEDDHRCAGDHRDGQAGREHLHLPLRSHEDRGSWRLTDCKLR